MKKIKILVPIMLSMSVSITLFTGCNQKQNNQSIPLDTNPSPIESDKATDTRKNTQTENESTDNTTKEEMDDKNMKNLDFTDIPLSGHVTSEKEYIYEAEKGTLSGDITVADDIKGYEGSGYVTGFNNEEIDTCTFHIHIEESGAYDLNFISASLGGYKSNFVSLDGINIGSITIEDTSFVSSPLNHIYIEAGDHDITVSKNWGWIALDSLKITPSKPLDSNTYLVSKSLINPNATKRTKQLMSFLSDAYGSYIISGQYADTGMNSMEFKAIEDTTGKTPAILGLDLIEYSPSRMAHGSSSNAVNYAMKFDQAGGIVTFCWHWNAPSKYLYDSDEQPWWKGFYKEATNIDLTKIMNGEDKEGYDLLLSDIDVIAFQLKRLQAEDIPILWRPLHEASGGWFWWGNFGPDTYKELWKLLYDRLTNYHQLNNLIWVWNGQNIDWYPGDEYVDIIGEDIYPGEKVTSTQSSKFIEASDYSNSNKIIALTENGFLFDPDLAFLDDTRWAWFSTWSGEFILDGNNKFSEQYITKETITKVYNHQRVLTLDELPDLKNYPID